MKNKYLFSLLLLSLFLISSFVSSSEGLDPITNVSATMKVRANIIKPNMGINVPSLVTIGNMAPGYLSDRQDINITNTGNVNLVITPELEESYNGDVYNYLSFKRILDDPLAKIGDYSLELLKPNAVGGTRSERIYMYLDLTGFTKELNNTLTNHEVDVIFWATAL
ncbi:MAG: hypothetical protein WC260_02650 [Candidatus Pacearchaeota archaeon]